METAAAAPRPSESEFADGIVRRRRCRAICLRSTRARPRRARFCSTKRWPRSASRSSSFRRSIPQPGWVEHDPQGIWTTAVATARAAMASADVTAENVAAIGITNQRETTIVWDRATGKPIHNAIVWQDRRTHDACAALARAGHEKLVNERTGLLLDPYFSATKIAWMLDNVRRRARGGGSRQARLRHGRHVSAVAAHRRQGAPDRRHQCGAHAAARYPHRPVGSPSCSICSASRPR